jgi:pyruvate formate lyase activating enzyme
MDALMDHAGPAEIARTAATLGCRAVAYTYNDPIIFAEYATDVAAACRDIGIGNIAVTAGYISNPARADFLGAMDAANIDLKSFSDTFYRRITGARLRPILETIEYAVKEAGIWVELTTLIIPGHNDSLTELQDLTGWVAECLGKDVPVHFSAFHPDNRMRDTPPTPLSTLLRARDAGLDAGLHYVYLGNAITDRGLGTRCPVCEAMVVARRGYAIVGYGLTEGGDCGRCGAAIPGRWDSAPGSFGPRRIPVRLSEGPR